MDDPNRFPGTTLRVALVVNHLRGGGKEQCVVNLANALPTAGVQPVVVCLERAGALAARIHRAGVPVVELGKKTGNDVRLPLRLARVLRDQRVDVVNCHNWGTLVESVVAARLAGGCPVVHTQHGLDFELGVIRDGAGRWWRRVAKRLAARGVSQAIAVSDEVADLLRQEWRMAGERVQVVLNGITPIEAPLAAEREEMRRSLGVSPDQVLVVSVGFLRPVKGHVTLIEALALARAKCPTLALAIAGSGPSLADIEHAIARTSTASVVKLLGRVDDVPRLLPACDIFALASLSEGLSISILEAMAAGLPVVATRVGGNPLLVEDSRSGLLTTVGAPDNLANALAALAADPALRARMGSRGREIVESRFSLTRMAADYAGVFHRAAGR